jgi:hypothetical protein
MLSFLRLRHILPRGKTSLAPTALALSLFVSAIALPALAQDVPARAGPDALYPDPTLTPARSSKM